MQGSSLDHVGRTPLVPSRRSNEGLSPTIAIKLGALIPGGSIKDLIGLAMIEEVERRGIFRPGGTIIEATAEVCVARRVNDGLARLSVGIEGVRDLRGDLVRVPDCLSS